MNKVNAGIDISKKKFDVRMLFANSNALNRVFRNDPDGFSAFVNCLDQKDALLRAARSPHPPGLSCPPLLYLFIFIRIIRYPDCCPCQ